MRHEILYQPSYSVARLLLEPGESVRAESGAMVSMSPTINLESKTGGLGKMFGRLLGGESAFQTTFTAAHGAGEVLLAPSSPGDIVALPLNGQVGMVVTSGCFLASDVNVEIETFASARGFFSGEGLFMMRMHGQGMLLLSTFGAMHQIELGPGQPYIVDTGHIVAFSDGMGYQLKKAARSLLGSLTSGEGIVVELTGPGRVLIQTRTPQGFGGWLSRFLPTRS